MSKQRDPFSWHDDFIGAGTFGTSASEGDRWVVADTSSSGTPTYQRVDHGESTGDFAPGVARLAFSSTTEIQNVCLSFGDKLSFDIDKVQKFRCRLKMNQTAVDSTTSLAFGLTGDRNDAIDSIAIAALFRVIGADSTTAVVVETDDGTVNNDDVATNQTLINAYKWFEIDFTQGTDDVRFYMDDGSGTFRRVASGTTFDMSNHTGGLQPFFQLQKTSDNNTDGVDIDFVEVEYKR